MKKIYFITCCILFATQGFSFSVNAQDNVVDEIAWIVGDEAILKSDIENARLELQVEGQRPDGDPYCIIPEQMAIQKLFLHQAALDSITANESQVLQYVETWINGAINQVGSKEKLEEYLNKPIAQIREERRDMVREQQIVRQMQQKIVGDIKLTPADIRKFYSQLPQDSLPYIPTTVEVGIITIEPKIALEEIARVKEKLREFADRVNKGEVEFSTLARMYSEDTESAKRGGELGFMGKGMLDPEFAAAAFSMNDPKKVSRIVQSEYGYHIIQLIEKRGDRVNVRHILLKPKVSDAELNNTTLKLDSIANDIRNGKFTFEDAATFISYDKDTRNNKGLMVNRNERSNNYGTSRFEMGELPQEAGKIIYGMKVGEISKPFTMIDQKQQKEVVAIVKLKSKTEGHKANISDDYQTLKILVENQKREEILNDWIAKKQKETYIRINDDWKNCDFQRDGWIK
ncbi:MAG: peptidylprolyl isomerase [Candidatus Azobacteroides sp.]|nr:peptidylprolyl isomerase [Candidatus Azobacteroides sp.]